MFFSELSDSQLILKTKLRKSQEEITRLQQAYSASVQEVAAKSRELHETGRRISNQRKELARFEKRVRELEAEIEVRDNSANETLRILREALPDHGFHSEMEAADAAKEEIRQLEQANGDLRRERDRAVAEAQRQDGVAKVLRAKLENLEEEHTRLRTGLICAMNDIQHGLPATGHAKLTLLLDGIMRSPGNLAERLQAQLAAATERADRLKARAERAEHISDECANQNAALRAALEKIAEANYCWDCDSNSDGCRIGNCTRKIAVYALALTPPAAVKEEELDAVPEN